MPIPTPSASDLATAGSIGATALYGVSPTPNLPRPTAPIFPWKKSSVDSSGFAPSTTTTYPWEKPGKVPEFSSGTTRVFEEREGDPWAEEWWNYEESYTAETLALNMPKGATRGFLPFKKALTIEDSPYRVPTPDSAESSWDAIWRGVQNKAWLVTESAIDIVEPIYKAASWKEARETYGSVLNYYFGNPTDLFGRPKKEGQVRGAFYTALWEQPAIVLRNVIGTYLKTTDRQGDISSIKANLLYTGKYEDTIRDIRGRSLDELETELRGMGVSSTDVFSLRNRGLLQDWDTLKSMGLTSEQIKELRAGGQIDLFSAEEQLKTAAAEQAEFDRLMREYSEEFGFGEDVGWEKRSRLIPSARNAYIQKTLMQRVLEEIDFTSRDSLRNSTDTLDQPGETGLERAQAWASGERLLPWSQTAQENYDMGKGFRWSHAFNPGLGHAFETYVDAGMDVSEAAELTTDPLLEAKALFLMDPNWVLGLDNLAMLPITAVAGPVLKGARRLVGGIAKRIPLLRGGYAWMVGITANTAGNRAAGYVEDAVRAARKYLAERGAQVSSERIQWVLKNPPSDFAEALPRFVKRAIEDIHPKLSAIFREGAALFDDITISGEIANLSPTDAILKQNDMFEEFLKKLKGTGYGDAKAVRFAENPWVDKTAVNLLFHNPLTKIITGLNSVAVDIWLGLRPSWNVFNARDNTVRMLVDGVNPATSLSGLVKRASAYAPDLIDNLDAVQIIKDRKFWLGGTKRNTEFVEQLARISPSEALSTFSGELLTKVGDVKEAGSILRKIPVVGAAIKRNFAKGNVIESIASLRTYYHHFFDRLDEGWEYLQRADIEEISGGILSDDVADAIRSRLNILKNPTTATVASQFDDVLSQNHIVVSNFNNHFSDTLPLLSPAAKSRIQSVIDATAIQTPGGRVSAQPILDIFTDELRKVDREAYDMMVISSQALRQSLSVVDLNDPIGLEIHLFRGKAKGARTVEDYAQAMEDFPAITASFSMTRLADNAQFFDELAIKQADSLTRLNAADYGAAIDQQLLVKDANEWTSWETLQHNYIDEWMDELDELRSKQIDVRIGLGGAPSDPNVWNVSGLTVDQQSDYVHRMLDAANTQGLNARAIEGELTGMFSRGVEWEEAIERITRRRKIQKLSPVVGGPLGGPAYTTTVGPGGLFSAQLLPSAPRNLGDALKDELSRMKAMKQEVRLLRADAGRARRAGLSAQSVLGFRQSDNVLARLKPQISDDIHQTMVDFRTWFVGAGSDPNLVPSFSNINRTGMLDMFDNLMDDVELSSQRGAAALKRELNSWKTDVLSLRTVASRNVPMTDDEVRVMFAYKDAMVGRVNGLISDASEYGFKKRDDLLIDYGTTSNFTSWLGNVVPFVRFPSKTLPMWINKFQEVPHLLGSVIKARQVHALINKDLPDRLKYTVGIPRELTDWF
ncbi:hypothetical protein LCGC14_1143660, partial [marine sediment metagenome]